MNAVSVGNDGTCCDVIINQTVKTKKISWSKKPLHLHFHDKTSGVSIFSTNEPRSILGKCTAHCEFILPPPLNTFVYPLPVFALKMKDDEVMPLTVKEFNDVCSSMGQKACRSEESAEIYDVPAVPLMQFEDEEALDCSDEEEEQESDNNSEGMEESDGEEEDNGWEIDDDDAVAVPSNPT